MTKEPPNHSTLNHNALDTALAFFRERSAPYPSPFAPETAKEFLQVYLAAAHPSPDRSQRRAAALDAFYGLLGTPATGDVGDDLDVILAAYDGASAPSESSVMGASDDLTMRSGFADSGERQIVPARSEIPVIDKALANAAEILANFKSCEPHTDGTLGRKLEEWQAYYAKLFTQMNEMVQSRKPVSVEHCYDCDGRQAEITEIVRVARDNPAGLREFLQMNFPREWGLSREEHKAIL